ncbi:MAG: hypothetical protein JWM21_4163 [Acidobacteria bacterium]|nr:hypothetical protein [Acidobacteriota bacterium]
MLTDPHSLFDDFEYSGFWWLPSSAENRVPGTLRYKVGDRMTLELLGSLQGDSEASEGDFDSDIILGIAEGNRICTLQKIIRTSSKSIGRNDVHRSSFIVHRLFEGKHFASVEDIRLASLSISYTSLEEWITDCPYDKSHETDESSGTLKFIASHLVPYPVFESRVASLNSTIRGNLTFEHSLGIRELEWKSTGYIDIVPDEPASFEWLWQVQGDIRNLFTLLMNEPAYLKRIEGYGDEVEVTPGRFAKERIYIYVMQSSDASGKEIHPADMLLIFPTIKEHISAILDNWFSKADPLRAVYTLFFGSMYFSTMYPRFHFLNLIQAIESFHRDMRKGEYLSQEAFEQIRATLTKTIPKEIANDFRESLKSKIRYGYEYSLRTRLRRLFDELEVQTVQLMTQNVNDLRNRIVDTRNYFTHYTAELKKVAFDGENLDYANFKLRVLLIILLLKEVGLSEAVIRDAICGNNELAYGLSEGTRSKSFSLSTRQENP